MKKVFYKTQKAACVLAVFLSINPQSQLLFAQSNNTNINIDIDKNAMVAPETRHTLHAPNHLNNINNTNNLDGLNDTNSTKKIYKLDDGKTKITEEKDVSQVGNRAVHIQTSGLNYSLGRDYNQHNGGQNKRIMQINLFNYGGSGKATQKITK